MVDSGSGSEESLIPRTPRYAFLGAENLQGEAMVCRLPECSEPVPRTRGQGRNRWFHDDKHQKEFQRRREALDELIDRLVERHSTEPLTWRARTRLEWEIRWLIGMRSSYVGPSDWLEKPSPPSPSPKAVTLTDLQVAWRTKARPPASPCPVCDGSGDARQIVSRVRTNSDQFASDAKLERVSVALWELRSLLKSDEGNRLADEAEDMLIKKFPDQQHLVRGGAS